MDKGDRILKSIGHTFLILALVTANFVGLMVFVGMVDEGGVEAATIIVDASGNGDYTKISSAIAAANNGDTIKVWAGTYNEAIFITKTITLIGNGSTNTTINSGTTKNAFTINANYVNITGFTITNCDRGLYFTAGINCIISDNNISDNSYGIFVLKSNNIFKNNTIKNNNNGIYCANCNSNKIIKNNFTNNRLGIVFTTTNSNDIIKNYFDNKYYDIQIQMSNNIEILNNSLNSNFYGIMIHNSQSHKLFNNKFYSNGVTISGYLKNNLNTHILPTNNTVNDKPIYYWKNKNGGTVPKGAGQIILANCQNISIENQNCSNTEIGITLAFSKNIKIRNNTLFSNRYGIYVFKSDSIDIVNNTVLNSSEYGIYLHTANHNYVIENRVDFNSKAGISMGNSDWNMILNNTANFNLESGIFIGGSNCTISNNKCSNNSYFGIGVAGSDNYAFDSSCKGNQLGGLWLVNSKRTIIKNNSCNNNKKGILLQTATENDVKNNTCNLNILDGIELMWANENIIENNICNFNQYNGIKNNNSNHNIIKNNTCNHNDLNGIYLHNYIGGSGTNIIIENNSCKSNEEHGIIINNSEKNTLRNNNLSNNNIGISIYGFSLGSHFNIITENTVYSNSFIGVSICPNSTNNQIYYNNIISNARQAKDLSNNFWNNSQLEGNYWSDYSGVDDGSDGRIKGDGIGDTNIPHLGLDNYPFIIPSGWLYPSKPTINGPGNIVINGNFTLLWNASSRTNGYILEEDNSTTFSSPSVIYNGSELSVDFNYKSNGTFYYRLRSFNDHYTSDWSHIVNVIVDWSPNAPKNLTAINISGHELTLTWEANPEPDIDGYNIYINDTDAGVTGPFRLLTTVTGTTTYFIVSELCDETKYHFKITAFDKMATISLYSNIVSITTIDITAPKAPTGIEAILVNKNEVELSWNRNIESDLAGYAIFINDTDEGSDGTFHMFEQLNTSLNSIIISTLTEQTTYYFKLIAFDEVPNNSSFSETISIAIPDITKPNTPTGLKITNLTFNSLTISWNPNTEPDVIGYLVQWSFSIFDGFKNISNDLINETYIVHSSLDEGTKYFYRIAAIDDADHMSPYTVPISATTLYRSYPPEINNTISNFNLPEDSSDNLSINLYYLFKDRNNDPLTFMCEGQKNINVKIYPENGTVVLTPKKDWNGEETLTFSASDGMFEIVWPVKFSIDITVSPINDPPQDLEIVKPIEGVEFYYGSGLDFESVCEDPDLIYGDELTYVWSSNISGKLGTNQNLTNIILDPGKHLITLEVKDKAGKKLEVSIKITINQRSDQKNGDSENKGFYIENLNLYLILIIVIIITIVILVFLFMRRKKGKTPDEKTEEEDVSSERTSKIEPQPLPPLPIEQQITQQQTTYYTPSQPYPTTEPQQQYETSQYQSSQSIDLPISTPPMQEQSPPQIEHLETQEDMQNNEEENLFNISSPPLEQSDEANYQPSPDQPSQEPWVNQPQETLQTQSSITPHNDEATVTTELQLENKDVIEPEN